MDRNRRHSIRLRSYDYSQNGYYFVTICAQNREEIFGEIIRGQMKINLIGKMIRAEWVNLTNRFKNIGLDEFMIMPNHIHGIIEIVGATLVVAHNKRAGTRPAPTESHATLGQIIGAFKSITTHKYILGIQIYNWPTIDRKLWQRNYYEHIIRNERDYFAIKNISKIIPGIGIRMSCMEMVNNPER